MTKRRKKNSAHPTLAERESAAQIAFGSLLVDPSNQSAQNEMKSIADWAGPWIILSGFFMSTVSNVVAQTYLPAKTILEIIGVSAFDSINANLGFAGAMKIFNDRVRLVVQGLLEKTSDDSLQIIINENIKNTRITPAILRKAMQDKQIDCVNTKFFLALADGTLSFTLVNLFNRLAMPLCSPTLGTVGSMLVTAAGSASIGAGMFVGISKTLRGINPNWELANVQEGIGFFGGIFSGFLATEGLTPYMGEIAAQLLGSIVAAAGLKATQKITGFASQFFSSGKIKEAPQDIESAHSNKQEQVHLLANGTPPSAYNSTANHIALVSS